jgi:hypothetical protein
VHCGVGGSYPEAALSDMTLSWMMGKAKALGLDFDDGAWARYGTIAPQHALDTIHESWSMQWMFPKRRSIANGATLANSVSIRCRHDAGFRPENLQLGPDGVPAGYATESVVAEP